MPHARKRPMAPGLSLLELVVALAIVGLLAAVALPAYQGSVRKSRRGDAIARLVQVQQAQERWRANQAGYAASLADLRIDPTVPGGHYGLALQRVTAHGYDATATPLPGSPQAADAPCGSLTLSVDAGAVRYASSAASAAGAPDLCWNR